jgi:hypothetical protein
LLGLAILVLFVLMLMLMFVLRPGTKSFQMGDVLRLIVMTCGT